MTLLDLPDEILLTVISQVDIDSLFSFRKTCHRLHSLTKDAIIWKNILRWQCFHLPLYENNNASSKLPVEELERLAVRTIRIDEHWLRKRTLPARVIPKRHNDGVLLSEIFSGRWILVVSSEGKVECHDSLLKTCATFQLRGRPWSSSAALFCEDRVLLALTAITQTQRTPVTALVEVQLHVKGNPIIEHIGGFVTQFPANVQVLGSGYSEDLVAFTRGCFIDIDNWKTKAHVTIATHTDELDELWNGIIGIRFCGKFLLCIKVRTVEVYEIPPVEGYGPFPPNDRIHVPDLVNPLEMYRFGDNNFRHAAFSDYTEASDTGIIRILLSDVLQGLYLFDVHLRPTFSVSLIGKRTLGPKEGFVGAFALGPQGKRGVWVERKRSDTQRSVMTFNAPDVCAADYHADEDASFKSGVVYEIKSYDLREDFIDCSLSETTGRIVLSKRSGDIAILDCWKPLT